MLLCSTVLLLLLLLPAAVCPAAVKLPSWSSMRSGSWYGSTTLFPLLTSAGRERGSCTCT
ncbi:uncharacterized protein LY89DRAFT_324490 [Mollisia scopiformis]|uniref:Uncharacterized protein n=1 Tax=Mollisia scopiformis TaxID=149040 RepID=A0A132B8J1_MOLSC|nr:uncharacterized protein LY89DRAFT_324490 [Mollisia scopiformis]KUJ08691.1 hypothetical protein LY89DRAFT_324490 [Mollisia scopiformis]